MSPARTNVARRRTAAAGPSPNPRADWLGRLAKARTGDNPAYLRIAEGLAAAIAAGELSAGDRLPAQRAVAAALGVDLTTVTRAYAHARARGLLEGETGRGTFVRGAGSAAGPVIDLSMNMPPPPEAVSLRALISNGLSDLLKQTDPAALMTYRAGPGARRDRAAGAAWLAPRLPALSADRVLLAPGAQAALAALVPMLARPGDTILTEALTYPGMIAAAKLHGVRLAALTSDKDGPTLASLEAALRHKPRALYLIPTLQNPTARTMSEPRRRAIAAFARKHDLTIIEDDAYGALLPDHTPLAALAPERTYLVSTLSKCLSPGLRTAFVVAPDESAAANVTEALRATSLMPPPLLSDLAVRWIEDNTARTLLDSMRAESAARMKLARRILPARTEGGPEGFHLWLTPPKNWTLEAYVAAAAARGVVTVGSAAFAASPDAPEGVRISLGAAPDREQLVTGLSALAALEDAPPPRV